MTPAVTHRPGRFSVTVDGADAYLDYALDGDVLDAQHTCTPPALRGRGLAAVVTAAAFEYARAHALRVRPTCRYVAGWVARHPDLRGLVAP